MKYVLSITLCCTFFRLFGVRTTVPGATHPLNSGPSSNSCIELITWKIDSLDPRYDLDEEILKDIMTDVSKLWSDAVGRKLFAYSDRGVVTLNLIYSDEQKYTEDRQQKVDQINKMKKNLLR